MRIPIFGGNFGGNITMGVYANVRVLGKVEVHICKMASLGAYHIILGPAQRITSRICSRSLGA